MLCDYYSEYSTFDPSSRTSISGTNRVKRHGGKSMRVLQTKNVYLQIPTFLMITCFIQPHVVMSTQILKSNFFKDPALRTVSMPISFFKLNEIEVLSKPISELDSNLLGRTKEYQQVNLLH